MLIELAKSAALLLALGYLQSFVARRWPNEETTGKVVSGILFGGICVIGMTTPIEFSKGVIFDGRFVILSTASFFGGPVVGIITAAISSIYRLWIGGAGAYLALGAVGTSVAIGLLYRYGHAKGWLRIGLIQYLIFGIVVHCFVVLWMLLLPPEIAFKAIKEIGPPMMLVFGPATAILGLLLQDIKRRVQIETELHGIREQLNDAIENISEGFVVFDADGRLVESNRRYREFYGYSEEDARPGIHTRDLGVLDLERGIVTYSGEPGDYVGRRDSLDQLHRKFIVHLKDGRILEVRDRKTSSGGVVSIQEDVTVREQARQNLQQAHDELERRVKERTLELNNQTKVARQSEKKYRAIFETSGVGMAMCKLDGTITECNEAFADMIGYDIEDIYQLTYWDITPQQYENDEKEQLRLIKENGKYGPYEKHYIHKNGSWVPVLLNGSLVEDVNDESYIWSIVQDISIRVKAENSVRSALATAEQANKMKSEFLANMSHELRTPLNAIIGFSSSIKGEFFGPVGNPKYVEYLDDIYHSGQHLLELINDILDVSAIEAGALELHDDNVNLPDIIETSIHMLKSQVDKGEVHITSSVAPETPLISADERRIKQIMLNLLSNAVKFTPKGGEITIASSLNDDGTLVVTFSDTGIGMDENEIEKALRQFGQVDSGINRKHQGTGLGLPLTEGLMKLHGGTMEIISNKGQGTQISLTFPKERVGQNICKG